MARRKGTQDDALRRLRELQLPLWTDEDAQKWADEARREIARAEGERGKEIGMARAAAAKQEWLDEAFIVLIRLARTREPFTSEDVTAVVGFPSGGRAMHANNAVGALFGIAARDGIIRKVRTVNAANGPAHTHLVNEWVGNI
jgi:hypothetical protein